MKQKTFFLSVFSLVMILGVFFSSLWRGETAYAAGETPSATNTIRPTRTKAASWTPKPTQPSRTPTASRTPTSTQTPSQTPSSTPTITNTPQTDADAAPQVWLDSDIDLNSFSPTQSLELHFSAPMNVNSVAEPVLFWPDTQGKATWNTEHTTLTLSLDGGLKNNASYTFFPNPALLSEKGKALVNAPEWQLKTVRAARVIRVSPSAGALDQRLSEIHISFSEDMSPALPLAWVALEPAIPFELSWETNERLLVRLEKPLEFDQKYRLLLSKNIPSQSGATLAEDQVWLYEQPNPRAQVVSSNANEVKISFNYALDREKTGLAFSISPELKGSWEWVSGNEVLFKSLSPFNSNILYSAHYPTLVDRNGFELPAPESVTFSGPPPMRVLEKNGIKRTSYDEKLLSANNTTWKALYIEFDGLVDHASAEKAFSISPAAPGAFSWESDSDGRDTLVYTFQPDTLQVETTYTIQIANTITARDGKPFSGKAFKEQIYIYQSYSYNSIFGEEGDNIQVVDANGPRAIQINGRKETTFAAYRFDLIDFAALYAKYYKPRGYSGNNNIPIPEDLEASARWNEIRTHKVGNESMSETILPGGLEPGLYIVNAIQDKEVSDQLFVVLTRNTLVVKQGQHEAQVWVTDIKGKAVEKAEIRVYNAKGEKIREGESDENGLYRVPLNANDEAMLVSARVRARGQPDDVSLAGFEYGPWGSDINEQYGYGSPVYWLSKGQPFLLYAYTDRPIYRPGQEISFKVALRQDNDARYSLPEAGTPVTIQVQDARNNVIYETTLNTNSFGTVNGSFSTSKEAMTGTYSLLAEIEGVSDDTTFKVEDYRKPEFQVSITPLQPEKRGRYISEERIQLKVNVAYYFGEPLAGVNLEIKAFEDSGYPINTLGIMGERITDADGNTTLSIAAPYDHNRYYYSSNSGVQRVRLEITANDGSNQPVTGIYVFDVYSTTDQIILDTGSYYFNPDEDITLQINDLGLDDKPIAGRKLQVGIQTWDWDKYEYAKTDQVFSVTTGDDGKASQTLRLKRGYHNIEVTGKDDLGNPISYNTWVYVFKEAREWLQRSKQEHLAVTAEKARYKPYEKAKIAIESSFSGPALLTFERGSVINSKQIELTAPMTIIETEIIPEHAPNVYITVNAWQAASDKVARTGDWFGYESMADSYLRVANTYVEVEAGSKVLDIRITPAQAVYQPGETASVTIQVNEADGSPAQAELSLAVVDESIFALANPAEANIFDAFYSPRGLSVSTYDSMSPSRILMAGGRGGGGDSLPPAARTDFRDTSTWLPVIETDANGQTVVQFKLPDNTTRWRLSVKAITRESKVGQAEGYLETKKDFFLRPIQPRALTYGDSVSLVSFVHNYSDKEQTVRVLLEAPTLAITSGTEQQVTLQPGQALPVTWQVWVGTSESVRVAYHLLVDGVRRDAVELPLEIHPASVRETQVQNGRFTGEQTLEINLPQVDQESSRVTLTLSRSLGGTLLQGLDYLIGFPYGCVEQTMSRALPNAVVANAEQTLALGPEAGAGLKARLPELIRASLDKLYALQHGDGGWGWWSDDVSDDYQTAWVLFGLSVIRDAGYDVSPSVMENAVDWLNDKYGNREEADPRLQAYIYYSLARAGYGNKEKTIALAQEQGKQLDPFSQASLALALHELGEDAQARAMLTLLETGHARQGSLVYWPQAESDGEYHRKTMSSTLRTTAMALMAYAKIDPQNPLLTGIVEYLASKRRGSEGWGTTNETSYTILALTEYLQAQASLQGPIPYNIALEGETLVQGVLDEQQPTLTVEIPMEKLKTGQNNLQLKNESETPLYFDLVSNYYRTQADNNARGEIKITRTYADVQYKQVVNILPLGKLIEVTLTIDLPEDVSYLALEDYLPGGLEALNERLNNTQEADFNYWEAGYDWYLWDNYGYNYKEIRGDRVVFFFTQLKKGKHTFTYLARASHAGQFTALPAQAYAMYDAKMWGRSAQVVVEIK